MHRFSFFSLPVILLMMMGLSGLGRAGERASGFGPEVSPAEREMAQQPEPDGYFREMIGFWHGVPGLEALRARWEGFAAGEPGFAVLAALIPEAEGRPEESLQKLKALPGSAARWNEGRLLALMGREEEAAAVLSPLVTTAESPEMGAAALIALTERDAILGDFARALQRTTSAWEARQEEGFRLRILERHLSLLVEAGQEKAFLEEQVRLASLPDAAVAGMAEKVMLVMSDWFTQDERLRAVRAKLAASFSTTVISSFSNGLPSGSRLRKTMDCGVLRSLGRVREAESQDAGESYDTAIRLANTLASRKDWPQNLESQPLLKRFFAERPLSVLEQLFTNYDPAKPLPPLARNLVETMPAGVERRVLDLVERAWAGKGGPEAVEALSAILVEAPELRRKRPPGITTIASKPWGWPALPSFPTEEVIWNLNGEAWLKFYQSSCRLAPLMRWGAGAMIYREESRAISWARWRPEWPVPREAELTVWAWSQLVKHKEGTLERAAEIAGRMPDPGQRFWFAALIRQKELLVSWCQDAALLKQIDTASLMESAHALQAQNQVPATEEAAEALAALAGEIARRMNLDEKDLSRSLPVFRRGLSGPEIQALGLRPVNPDLAMAMGVTGNFSDAALREHWKSHQLNTVPHPLYGLAVSPSVERFRVVDSLVRLPIGSGSYGMASPRQQVASLMLGRETADRLERRAPELLEALKPFPTAHPLKRQLARWNELYITLKLREEASETESRSFKEVDPKRDVRLSEALRTLAEEEQASSLWLLVRAALEPEAARRAALFGDFRARSPMQARAGNAITEQPAPRPRPVPPKIVPETVAGHFAAILKDPDARQTLEPVGTLNQWMNRSGPRDAFLNSFYPADFETYPAIASHLLDLVDPLAARMAVIVMTRQIRQGQQVNVEPWLLRALAIFPEDPELLLAFGALHFQRQEIPEHARAAFVRGLDLVKAVTSFERETDVAWCGVRGTRVPAEAGIVRAIAAMVERVKPDALPQVWVQALEGALGNPEELARMSGAEMQSAVLAAVRYKTPWRPGDGTPQGWVRLLTELEKAGEKEAAAAAAEALLSRPDGALVYARSPGEPAPPWQNSDSDTVTGPGAEGWQLLLLAERGDPASLASRLSTAAAAHPRDEQVALAALLAQGRSRTLTENEVKLPGLSKAGRHRVLAYASWLLPPDRLPAALVLESWEAEAVVEFSSTQYVSPDFLQGVEYLDRLEAAGATDAVRRVLPSMISVLENVSSLPTEPAPLFRRVARLGTKSDMERLQRVLVAQLQKLPEIPQSWIPIATFLDLYLDEPGRPDLPPELVQRVTQILETAAAGRPPSPPTFTIYPIYHLAYAAAGDPRWHPILRRLLLLPQEKQSAPPEWHRLSALMEVLESGRVIPEVALEFSPTATGQGKLTWNFRGVMPLPTQFAPNPGEGLVELPWATLAAPLSEAFDALVFATGDDSRERLVQRFDSLPARGETTLTGLPPSGRLHLILIRRQSPHYSAATSPQAYKSPSP